MYTGGACVCICLASVHLCKHCLFSFMFALKSKQRMLLACNLLVQEYLCMLIKLTGLLHFSETKQDVLMETGHGHNKVTARLME